MATRQYNSFDPKSFSLKVAIALLLMVIAVACVTMLKSFSYAKITPTSVEVEVTALEAQDLAVEYDYGYGFNPAHRQMVPISQEPKTQVKRLTISAWKSLLSVRVKAENPGAVTVQSVTLQQGGNLLRIVSPKPSSDDGVLMLIKDVPAKFANSIVGGL